MDEVIGSVTGGALVSNGPTKSHQHQKGTGTLSGLNGFDGLIAVLDKAQAAGLKLGVCTNKVEGLSRKLLTELGMMQRFGSLVGGDTLPVMKPDPAPLFEAIARLGVDPGHALMVGDSETDIRTAQNAAVPVLAVTFGYTPQHVRAFDPTHMVDHYDEAWGILERYL